MKASNITLLACLLLLFLPLLPSRIASAEAEVGYAVGDRFVYNDNFIVKGYGREILINSEIEITVKSLDEDEIVFKRIESGKITWPTGSIGMIQYLDSHGAEMSSARGDSFIVKNEIVYSGCNREFIMGEGVHTVKVVINVQSGQFRNVLWGSLSQYHPLDYDDLLVLVIDPGFFLNSQLDIKGNLFDVSGPEFVQVPAGSISSYLLSKDGESRWYDLTTGLLVKKEVVSNLGTDTLELTEVKLGTAKYVVCPTVVPEFEYYSFAVIAVATLLFIVVTKSYPKFKKLDNRSLF